MLAGGACCSRIASLDCYAMMPKSNKMNMKNERRKIKKLPKMIVVRSIFMYTLGSVTSDHCFNFYANNAHTRAKRRANINLII